MCARYAAWPMTRCSATTLTTSAGEFPVVMSAPASDSPWPGVVVIHDALGMTSDVHRHVEWLASEGFLAAAPDLYHRGARARCLFAAMRDLGRGAGRSFEDIETVRCHLQRDARCNGRIGIIGFCLGGGYAFALAPSGNYAASGPSYGAMTKSTRSKLPQSCPIVASYGALDGSLEGEAQRLEETLCAAGIPHDVKLYDGVGHGFMNLHSQAETPWLFKFLGGLVHTKYDETATLDARRRIAAFFRTHLAAS